MRGCIQPWHNRSWCSSAPACTHECCVGFRDTCAQQLRLPSKRITTWFKTLVDQQAHHGRCQVLLRNLSEWLDWEQVVVRSGQLRRGYQCEAADVAAAGQLGHAALAAGAGEGAAAHLALCAHKHGGGWALRHLLGKAHVHLHHSKGTCRVVSAAWLLAHQQTNGAAAGASNTSRLQWFSLHQASAVMFV